jgi:chaperonin GroEL
LRNDSECDTIKVGVIDPAKVTRLALQNAASMVALMLTTDINKEDEEMASMGAGHGGMGGTY